MFGTIRKHQTWLWAIIITLTIIAFVVFFSPYSKVHDGGGNFNYGKVNGEKVTREDISQAQREVLLRYFFMSGQFPDDEARRRGFDVDRESYQWLFLIRKQEELGIDVDLQVAARTGRDMLSNFERQGISDPKVFAKQVLDRQGLNIQDFERFVKHYLGLQELVSLAGASGKLVTPQEARALYERENRQISTQVAVFSSSNFVDKVKVSPEAVAQFYTNYLASYRLPDRVQVAYVKFAVSNFLKSAETELSRSNLNDLVEGNIKRMGTNLYGGAKTPEEARLKLREEIIKAKAFSDARQKAYDFARPLIEAKEQRIEDLEKAAKAVNMQVITTLPFDRENGPADLEVGADFVKSAFSRVPEVPFAQPYVGMDGIYVYGLVRKVPSEIPPFERIRARVENDYKMVQAASLARQAGNAFHTSLTNGLAQGKSPSDLAKSTSVKLEDLPPFALSTRSIPGDIEERVPLNQLKELALTTEPGKASEFQPTRDGGVVLFVKAKTAVDEQKLKEELPSFVNYVRRARTEEAFQAWFRKEAEKGLRDAPLRNDQASQGQGKS